MKRKYNIDIVMIIWSKSERKEKQKERKQKEEKNQKKKEQKKVKNKKKRNVYIFSFCFLEYILVYDNTLVLRIIYNII